nr:Phosphoethanolamine transferase EptA specific for the 1 phosphate group of core-lipid A [Escherichia coli]
MLVYPPFYFSLLKLYEEKWFKGIPRASMFASLIVRLLQHYTIKIMAVGANSNFSDCSSHFVIVPLNTFIVILLNQPIYNFGDDAKRVLTK